MNLSYWQIKNWLTKIDFTIVGGGIVGLNCALVLRKKYPKSKILVLEKGVLQDGASTKNAGFACFGSISELLHDINTHNEEAVYKLVKKRWEGLSQLKSIVGEKAMAYKAHGGHEVFLKENTNFYENSLEAIPYVNNLLYPLFKKEVFSKIDNTFKFNNIQNSYIFNHLEGQLDPGKMMNTLLKKCIGNNILAIQGTTVKSFNDTGLHVTIETNQFTIETKKLFIATNGYASTLIDEDISPARAQVIITKPIEGLDIKGTFHLDKGYYYFRNIDNRILLGGGRNLDIQGETTTAFGESEAIQNSLEHLLKTVILPKKSFEIDHKWSGIMGVATSKNPIVKPLSENVFCGVRLGGMGVAIGTLVGQELAGLLD